MKTRLTFGVIAAGTLILSGLFANDAMAQRRPNQTPQFRPATPSIRVYPQTLPLSIQMTLRNAYMNEWAKRAALTPVVNPVIIVQPYGYYPYGYMNGYNPRAVNRFVR